MTEPDYLDTLWLSAGIGEFTIDDGSTKRLIELADRPEASTIDSTHGMSWFMQTEPTDIPATGSLSYAFWAHTTSDTLWRSLPHDPVRYNLRVVDTSGSVLARLDSVFVSDTSLTYEPNVRTVLIDLPQAAYGYLEIQRLGTSILDTGGRVEDILTPKHLGLKEANGRPDAVAEEVRMLADPNPFHEETTVHFELPRRGAVTLSVIDALGNTVATVLKDAELREGEHAVRWHPDWSHEPSGVYMVVITFGGRAYTTRVSYIK